jgi:hypothetical protein
MLEKAGTWAIAVGGVMSLGSLLAILLTGRPFVKLLVLDSWCSCLVSSSGFDAESELVTPAGFEPAFTVRHAILLAVRGR